MDSFCKGLAFQIDSATAVTPVDLSPLTTASSRALSHLRRVEESRATPQLRDAVRLAMDQGHLRPVSKTFLRGYAPVFTVRKSNGSHRLVFDGRKLNRAMPPPPTFNLPTIRTISRLIKPSYLLASIDLKDAFWTIPLNKKFSRLCGFRLDNQDYAFNKLPFGLSWAPWLFTQFLHPVLQRIRRSFPKIVVFAYLDDILLAGPPQLLRSAVKGAIRMIQDSGFTVNLSKSVTEPQTSIQYLGLKYTPSLGAFDIPTLKARSLRRRLRSAHKLRKIRHIQGLISSVRFYAIANPALAPLLRNAQLWTASIVRRKGWEAHATLPHGICFDLTGCANLLTKTAYTVPIRTPDYIIQTDATLAQWGSVCFNQELDRFSLDAGKFHTSDLSITHLEALAMIVGLETAINSLNFQPGDHVRVQGDNLGALLAISRGTAKDIRLSRIALDFWLLVLSHRLVLSFDYLPTHINIIADGLSRAPLDGTTRADRFVGSCGITSVHQRAISMSGFYQKSYLGVLRPHSLLHILGSPGSRTSWAQTSLHLQ